MGNKTKPSKVYTTMNVNNVGNEEDYTTKQQVENNPQWGEESIIVELFHIAKTYQHPRFEDLFMSQNDQHYYVNMPHSLIMLNQQSIKIDFVNLNEGSFENTQELLQ